MQDVANGRALKNAAFARELPFPIQREVFARCESLVKLRMRNASFSVRNSLDDAIQLAAISAISELSSLENVDSTMLVSACRRHSANVVRDILFDVSANTVERVSSDDEMLIAEETEIARTGIDSWRSIPTDAIARDTLYSRMMEILSALSASEAEYVRAILSLVNEYGEELPKAWVNGMPSAKLVAQAMGMSTSGPSRVKVKNSLLSLFATMRNLAEYSLNRDPMGIRKPRAYRYVYPLFPSANPITYPRGRFGNRYQNGNAGKGGTVIYRSAPLTGVAWIACGCASARFLGGGHPVSEETAEHVLSRTSGFSTYRRTDGDRVSDSFAESLTPMGKVAKPSRNAGKRSGSIGCSMTYRRPAWAGKAS